MVPHDSMGDLSLIFFYFEGSKSGLAGFFDPCDEKNKYLVIQYLYRGQIHQAQIQDREQLRCPRIAHQLAK